jgi:hypothetical protein
MHTRDAGIYQIYDKCDDQDNGEQHRDKTLLIILMLFH